MCVNFPLVLSLNLLFFEDVSSCASFDREIWVSFFQNDAALLLESRSANANAQ